MKTIDEIECSHFFSFSLITVFIVRLCLFSFLVFDASCDHLILIVVFFSFRRICDRFFRFGLNKTKRKGRNSKSKGKVCCFTFALAPLLGFPLTADETFWLLTWKYSDRFDTWTFLRIVVTLELVGVDFVTAEWGAALFFEFEEFHVGFEFVTWTNVSTIKKMNFFFISIRFSIKKHKERFVTSKRHADLHLYWHTSRQTESFTTKLIVFS